MCCLLVKVFGCDLVEAVVWRGLACFCLCFAFVVGCLTVVYPYCVVCLSLIAF